MSIKEVVVAVVGPTATGKTSLSIELALQLGGEIVACDSRTVYRHMNVGTAKPTLSEQRGVAHHMFDVLEPVRRFTVAEYKEAATARIHEIHKRGQLPIVCGGTGFYARALLEGLNIPQVAPQMKLREELIEFAEAHGNLALFERLQEIDSQAADRLNANDRFRVVRALEVCMVTGKPFSELATMVESPFDVIWIGLTVEDRAFLKELIKQRFTEQLKQGLVEEVESLHKTFGATIVLNSTVNYREFLPYIDGDRSLQDALDECIKHHNQLARRQLIWFRANEKITWFEIDSSRKNQLLEDVIRNVQKCMQ